MTWCRPPDSDNDPVVPLIYMRCPCSSVSRGDKCYQPEAAVPSVQRCDWPVMQASHPYPCIPCIPGQVCRRLGGTQTQPEADPKDAGPTSAQKNGQNPRPETRIYSKAATKMGAVGDSSGFWLNFAADVHLVLL
ncbi:hypothetical protein XENTR_v10013241 [Xenopus tropicalis]|nr:hypothetical protein XENTR_v10013241 [Xenopus tropicalis]KAE8600417.1 hypothetical protein XENTR_v10013241 [Xenopus tropicalis]